MSNTPHTLGEEFPDKMDVIHALKVADPQFARILEEYDKVNDLFTVPKAVSTQ